MNANELRIGNLVLHPHADKPFKVLEIFTNGISIGDNKIADVLTHGEARPIPLTPEILEKAGFKVEISEIDPRDFIEEGIAMPPSGKWENYMAEKDCITIDFNAWYGWQILGDGYTPINEMYYFHFLHQLQNLYFALSGTELEINLNP